MCGIAGILRTWQPGEAPPDPRDAIPEAWLDILDDSIKHRGPDGQGRFRQRVTRPDGTTIDVALVHRRLSIIDHADGHQPMVIGSAIEPLAQARGHAETSLPHPTPPLLSREGHPYQPLPTPTDHHTCPKCGPGLTAVVFNGCIYNHRELRAELEAAGHTFHTDHSDTEVLLHGWREWGPLLFDRLESMHAAAIWDTTPGSILLARDDFGEKPLYVSAGGDESFIVFASTPFAVAFDAADGHHLAKQPDPIVEWIRFGYDAEVSPFTHAIQLGHGDVASTVDPRPERPARLAPLRRDRKHAAQPALPTRIRRALPRVGPSDKLLDRIDRAVELAVTTRLEADVPLGCLLSGGVDSSLIAANAARHLKELTTICVRMPDPQYDESHHAQAAASHIGTRHIVVDADPNPAEDLQLLIQSLGLPFGDSSLLPTYWACQAAAKECKALLSGDGGDELFLGYERYTTCRYTELTNMFTPLPQLASLLALTLPRRDPKSKPDKLARFLSAGAAGQDQAYREILSIFPRRDARRLFHAPRAIRPMSDACVDDPIKARDYDLQHHLPGDMLRKVDTASMLAGIEVRAPFLDRALAAAAMELGLDQLRPWGQRKGLLRALARRHLPAEIVDRPKMGFAIPIGEWFRTDYGGMRQLLYDHLESTDPFPGLADAGVEINTDFVRRMLREHDAAGERSINPWHGRDHSQRLYMLVVLSIWCKWLTTLTEPRA
ncbi:MAG: asparagine synthase (glutamine-hydrolyzing) [Phycisphaerales bacterium JB054]